MTIEISPAMPLDGGSYRREADGSLTLLHATTAPPLAKPVAPLSSNLPEVPDSSDAPPSALPSLPNRRSRREPLE